MLSVDLIFVLYFVPLKDCDLHAKLFDYVRIDIYISDHFKDRFHLYLFNIYFERNCIIYFCHVYESHGGKKSKKSLSLLYIISSVFRGKFEGKLSPKYSLLLSLVVWSGTAS